MKKIIKILLLTLLFVSCSVEEAENNQDCECITTYYVIKVGQPGYHVQSVDYDPQNLLRCKDAMDNIQFSGNANMFYKITCK